MTKIPDTAALRKIRERDKRDSGGGGWVGLVGEAMKDRHALLALIDDIIGQAHEGVFAEHECPAMFACAYIVAQTSAPEPHNGK